MVLDKDKHEVRHLYFERGYSYSKLIEHFKGKYTYAELKTLISKMIKEE